MSNFSVGQFSSLSRSSSDLSISNRQSVEQPPLATTTQPRWDHRTIYGTAERAGGVSLRHIPIVGQLIGLRHAIGRSISRYTAQFVLPSSRTHSTAEARNTYGTAVGTAILGAQVGFGSFQRRSIRTGDERQVDTILFTKQPLPPGLGHAESPKKIMLYLNANEEHMLSHLDHPNVGPLKMAKDLGVDVMVCDYGGVGKSTGTPSTKGMTQDVKGLIDYLVKEKGYNPEDIIVFGRSIGGGAALTGTEAYLQDHPNSQSPVVGVDRSFSSLFHATKYLPAEHLREHTSLPSGLIARLGKWAGAQFDNVRAARSLLGRNAKIIAVTHVGDAVISPRARFASKFEDEAISKVNMETTVPQPVVAPYTLNLSTLSPDLLSDYKKRDMMTMYVQQGNTNPQQIITSTAKIEENQFTASLNRTEDAEETSGGYHFSLGVVADLTIDLSSGESVILFPGNELTRTVLTQELVNDQNHYYILHENSYKLVVSRDDSIVFAESGQSIPEQDSFICFSRLKEYRPYNAHNEALQTNPQDYQELLNAVRTAANIPPPTIPHGAMN